MYLSTVNGALTPLGMDSLFRKRQRILYHQVTFSTYIEVKI